MPKSEMDGLRRDTSLFHLLVEGVRDYAIFALDPEGRIASWNRGAEHIKGYPEAEAVGRYFGLFFAPEDQDAGRPEALLRQATEEGRAEDEGWRVRRDGTRFWANAVITALRSAEGKLLGFAKVTRDLTERRAAEEQALHLAREQAARETAEASATGLRLLVRASELLASSLDYEATLRTVADLAVPGLADWCAVDLVQEDGTLRRVAVAHPDPAKVALAKRFMERYPAVRGAGSGPWQVIDTGEPEFLPEISEEMLAASGADEEQLAMLRELGLRSAVTVPLTGRAQPLGTLTLVQAESGRRLRETDVWLARELARHAALAIENSRLHHDLEDQNRLLEEQSMELETQAEELQLQAAQREELMAELEAINEALQQRTLEAEQANRAKSDFLAIMSHELRTPLNAIFGYAELIQMGLHGPVTPAQQDALERIKRNERALLVLINDLLNFAKLEAGKLEITITDVEVAGVIEDLERVVGPQLRARDLGYECEGAPPGLRVRGERERIEQILLNLLTNAIKFTGPGGAVSVAVEADAESVRIGVRDTGRGIPADRLAAIFDPFVQIDRQPEDSRERGVGLGLAISRELARAMGGTLTVESRPGEGSTFTLSLPRAD